MQGSMDHVRNSFEGLEAHLWIKSLEFVFQHIPQNGFKLQFLMRPLSCTDDLEWFFTSEVRLNSQTIGDPPTWNWLCK